MHDKGRSRRSYDRHRRDTGRALCKEEYKQRVRALLCDEHYPSDGDDTNRSCTDSDCGSDLAGFIVDDEEEEEERADVSADEVSYVPSDDDVDTRGGSDGEEHKTTEHDEENDNLTLYSLSSKEENRSGSRRRTRPTRYTVERFSDEEEERERKREHKRYE